MKFNQTGIFLIVILLGMMVSCADHDLKVSSCTENSFAKSVDEMKGWIWYHSEFQQYAIHHSIPGTYDSQDIGILCSIPDNFKTDGLQVVFSGDYYHYNSKVIPEPAGVTYYYLELKEIRLP